MADYLSRNEAINAIKSLESSMPAKDNYAKGYDAAIGRVLIAIREVPPASDVQPVKRGKWVNPVSVGNGIIFCSVCRNEAYWDTDYGQQLFDYCPYCGAKMIKDGDTNG